MSFKAQITALIYIFILGCTNGSTGPKSTKNTKTTSGSTFQNQDTESTDLFQPGQFNLNINSANYQAGDANNPAQIRLSLNYPSSPPIHTRTDLPTQVCNNSGCVCQYEWTDHEIGLRKSEANANPSTNFQTSLFCDLPPYFLEEVIFNPTTRSSIKISVKNRPEHANLVNSNLFSSTIQNLPTVGSTDQEFKDISKSVCYLKMRRDQGVIRSAIAQMSQSSSTSDTNSNPNPNINFSESNYPVLSSSQNCFSHYSNQNPNVGQSTLAPSQFRNIQNSNLDTGGAYSSFNAGTHCGTAPSAENIPVHTQGFPISLYQNSDNTQVGNTSNELFQCITQNGNLSKVPEFNLRSNPNNEYSVPVGARACLGNNCTRLDPEAHPCFANPVAANGSLFPHKGCLGFAKPIDQTGTCTSDSSGKPTFRLRKYMALYPPLFDVNGYPLPTDFTNGSPRPQLLHEEIFVLDRQNGNGQHQTGPLPCPIKFQTDPRNRRGSYIASWDMSLKSFNPSYFPIKDIADVQFTSTHSSGSYTLKRTPEASCAATLPIPFQEFGEWRLSINTVNAVSTSAHTSVENLLISDQGFLIRMDQPFSPVYVEDTAFLACARAPQSSQLPTPIALGSPQSQGQYCVQYLNENIPSSLGEDPRPISATQNEISNSISKNIDFRSRREPAGQLYRCKTTNTGFTNIRERYTLSPSTSCQ